IGSLNSTENRTVLKGGVSQAVYAQGQLLFVRDETLMAQRFDPKRLEISGEPVPLADHVVTGGGGGSTFSVSENGVLVYQYGVTALFSRLVWVDRDGKQTSLLGEENDYGDLELSNDGKRAAVSVATPPSRSRDIWIFELDRGVHMRLTYDSADEYAPVWSP